MFAWYAAAVVCYAHLADVVCDFDNTFQPCVRGRGFSRGSQEAGPLKSCWRRKSWICIDVIGHFLAGGSNPLTIYTGLLGRRRSVERRQRFAELLCRPKDVSGLAT